MLKTVKNLVFLVGFGIYGIGFAQETSKIVVVPFGGSEAATATQAFTKNYNPGQFDADPTSKGMIIREGLIMFYEADSEFTQVNLSTPLDLPQGAVMNFVRCFVDDTDSAIDFSSSARVTVARRQATSTLREEITDPASLETSGDNNGIIGASISTFDDDTIDNDQYYYSLVVILDVESFMGVAVTPPFTSSVAFYGCSIFYDLDVVTIP